MGLKKYDLIIIGGGILGTSLLYIISNYTNIKNVLLIEKEKNIALINSKSSANSQTLHEGDIETNYSYEKAKEVKFASSFTKNYLIKNNDNSIYIKTPKMVIGVGKIEIDFIKKRYYKFKSLFPNLKLLKKLELKKLEPKLFEKRNKNEKVIGLYNFDGFTIDFGLLSKSFLKNSKNNNNKNIKIKLNSKLKTIKKLNKGFEISLNNNNNNNNNKYYCNFLAFQTGAHSLKFAKNLGFGKNLSQLSVAGNFYFTSKYLKTKIYTIQNNKLPFAAVHGDPDITNQDITRFGPTTNLVFMLERDNYKTVFEYFKVLKFNLSLIKSFIKIMSNSTFFNYSIKHNLFFKIPILGHYLFLKEIRKIIPSLKFNELKISKKKGGIRPQIINTKDKNNPLKLGGKNICGKNILFNITPSPGASICLYNSYKDTKKIINDLGEKFKFDEKRFLNDFS